MSVSARHMTDAFLTASWAEDVVYAVRDLRLGPAVDKDRYLKDAVQRAVEFIKNTRDGHAFATGASLKPKGDMPRMKDYLWSVSVMAEAGIVGDSAAVCDRWLEAFRDPTHHSDILDQIAMFFQATVASARPRLERKQEILPAR